MELASLPIGRIGAMPPTPTSSLRILAEGKRDGVADD